MNFPMRQPSQTFADLYATVYLLDCVNRTFGIDGNLKVQKLLFLHEFKGIQNRLKSNHYKYFRHNFGPYSKDLANDIIELEKLGFISGSSRRLSKRGKLFLEYFQPEVQMSLGESLHYAQEICQEYGKFSGPQLVNKVYRLSVPVYDFGGTSAVVKEIPTFTDIFDPIHDATTKELPLLDNKTLEQMKEEFSIEESKLDPSSIGFKKFVNENLERALS